MLVGSLMRLAMHAPYGSDQISDRLPSPIPLCPPSSLLPRLLACIATAVAEQQSGPRLRIAGVWCIRDAGTLPGYKVRPTFDAGDDVRSGALAHPLIFIEIANEDRKSARASKRINFTGLSFFSI